MDLERKVSLSHSAVRFCLTLLFFSLILTWWLDTPALRSATVLMVTLLPLVIFSGGAWRGHSRALFWLSVILIVYVVKAVMNLIFSSATLVALLETFASSGLFISTICFIRWRARLFQSQSNPTCDH